MKLNKPTIHVPGHSVRGSGFSVGSVGAGVVVRGRVGAGRGLGVGTVRVLSQQTEPFLQFDVIGIRIAGRSQNAVIMFKRQNPGHRGAEI